MSTAGHESAGMRRVRCGEVGDGDARWPACRGMELAERHGSPLAGCRIAWSRCSGLPAEGQRLWSGGRPCRGFLHISIYEILQIKIEIGRIRPRRSM
jgi:hypothetical protein